MLKISKFISLTLLIFGFIQFKLNSMTTIFGDNGFVKLVSDYKSIDEFKASKSLISKKIDLLNQIKTKALLPHHIFQIKFLTPLRAYLANNELYPFAEINNSINADIALNLWINNILMMLEILKKAAPDITPLIEEEEEEEEKIEIPSSECEKIILSSEEKTKIGKIKKLKGYLDFINLHYLPVASQKTSVIEKINYILKNIDSLPEDLLNKRYCLIRSIYNVLNKIPKTTDKKEKQQYMQQLVEKLGKFSKDYQELELIK